MDTEEGQIARGAAVLIAGQPLIFPTDTVYGLGVAVGMAQSPALLFDIKGRAESKPVAWLVAAPEALALYGKDVPAYAFGLARAFWPGALSIVVRADTNVPRAFQSPTGTIALRMPASEVVCSLIKRVGVPLAATSANLSGQAAPRTYGEVDPHLVGRVGFVMSDRGNTMSGRASTVVDCTGQRPVIVRQGGISLADIEAHL